MAVLKIATHPAESAVLRARARPILRVTPAIRRLIADMIDTMKDAVGVGLAAPQVFSSHRLFVYDIGEGPGAILNPEIVHASGEEVDVEGCLSIPRLQGDVPRATRLTVTGLNENGRRLRVEAEGYLARVFQHEIDHLNGVLFIDRAIPESLHWLTDEQEEERRGRKTPRRDRGQDATGEPPVADAE